MKHYVLNKEGQWGGAPFTDLFIVGVKRGAGGSSDFTADDTTQTLTLTGLDIGDVVAYPAQAWVKQKFTDAAAEGGAPATLADLKADVGVTAALTQFIAGTDGDLINDPDYPIAPAAGGGPYPIQAASKEVLLTLTSSAGDMSTITFGELWIYLSLLRVAQFSTSRYA